ncbi:MAG TPA: FAD-binding oxidoreductase [Planctomycetota bacterium]|nr:FAD-binding oxidoreductase [Planctomycetota bacterium]
MREELVRIFGGVLEDVAAHASDMTENEPRTPAFVVEATRAEQVPELLRLATARGVPVTPKVTGLNIGGLAIPAEGGIVLDLRRLDRVEIDRANMVAWIEPGVSWRKLKEEAGKHGLVLGFPLAPPETSVLACALMDGLSTMALAHGSFGDWVHGVEAYLADGTKVVTGSAAISGRPLSRGPLPDLTGMFLNWYGSTGVVTRLAIALWPRRAFRAREILPFRSVEDAAAFLRAGARTGLFDDLGGLSWPAAKWAFGLDRLGPRDPNEPELYVIADYGADTKAEMKVKEERLRELAPEAPPIPVEELLALAPDLEPFAELPARLGFLMDHEGKGLTWIGTFGPMERLEEGARKGMRIVEGSGNPPLVVVRPMKGGHYAVLRFIFRFDKRTETERVRALMVELGRALMELGYVPYKCPATLYGEVAKRMDPGFRALMERLRKAMDPAGILNPDRWKLP